MENVLIVSNTNTTMGIISDLLRTETFNRIITTQNGAQDDAPIVGSRNGAPGAFEGVSAVYPLEGGVAGALYPVFHGEERLPVQPLKIVEQLVADAVGARAHHESHDAVAGERLLVASPYRIEVCIRVAVCLEIRQVFHVGVFPREERFAVADLLPDGVCRKL